METLEEGLKYNGEKVGGIKGLRHERRDNGKERLKVAMKDRGSKGGNEEEEKEDVRGLSN